MELKVFSRDNRETGKKKMPAQFSEPFRLEIIKRAVEAIQSNSRQPYGTYPDAGQRHSIFVSKRRRRFKGVYGKSLTRTPKKVMSHNGAQFNWVGAQVPNARGGRAAHPPKAEKVWDRKVNDKERKMAIRSALSAVVNKDLVNKRGHKAPAAYPFLLGKDFEAISKTKDFFKALLALGFGAEIERASKKSIRAGCGKSRGRPYKKAKGPLVVVSGNCALLKAAGNIPGFDVVDAKNINAGLLAPGCVPGRLALLTEGAVDVIAKEGLFE
jgi:large subunit ribosomal protein L4e